MKVIILAGGLGLRLRPLTSDVPKALVYYREKPIIHHQIDWLRKHNIKDIIIACGYKWEKIKEYLDKLEEVNIKYSIEEEALGTGGAIKKAMKLYEDEEFLVMNGDVLTDLHLSDFIRFYEEVKERSDGVILLVPFRSPYGIVYVEGGVVKEFREKPELPYWMNGGIYILKRKVIDLLPDKGDVEVETLPKLRLFAYMFKGYWKSIDTFKDLQE